MKKKCFLLFFILGGSFFSKAQNLNNYQYVLVPEKYEFQDENNEYLLNGLTAFLFEKKGFQVFYEEEVPQNIERCEILNANVIDESNIFRTKVKVELRDCYGNQVLVSEVGKSKFKEYRRSFQDALRDAFASVEKLNYQLEPEKNEAAVGFVIKKKKKPNKAKREKTNIPKEPKIEKGKVLARAPNQNKGVKNQEQSKIPENKEVKIKKGDFGVFVNGNQEYKLEKTESGFALFRSGNKKSYAILIKSGSGDSFIYSSNNIKGSAYFNKIGNLVVEYISPGTSQLVSLIYKKQD